MNASLSPALSVAVHLPVAPLLRIASPLTISGTVTGWNGAAPPAIRVRLGKRIIHCHLHPQVSPSTIPCHRFDADFSTSSGLKFLRFQIETSPDHWHTFARRLIYASSPKTAIGYPKWVQYNRLLQPVLAPPVEGPLISVIVPVYNPEPQWLETMINSVRSQSYLRWELCLADDASTDNAIPRLLASAAATDPRIKWIRRAQNGHISAATNSALALATGDYVAFLDQDDLLDLEALAEVVRALQTHPSARILYSDEDKIDVHGNRYGPHFKSGWNPDLLLGQNYFCHLTVYHTALVRTLGGLRTGYEGAQDWDLALRAVTEVPPEAIVHIPRILYHWRAVQGSTALSNDAKSYHLDAALRSLRDHLDRNHIDGEIIPVSGGHWRIRRTLPRPAPKVTIIIPTRNRLDLLRPCVESIFRITRYPDYELLVVDNGSDDPSTLAYLHELAETGRAHVLRDDGPFNYSALNNRAARAARGSVLALLNNDIEPINPDWLEEMVTLALRPETGAVGALLLYPGNRVQHAGVVLGFTGDPRKPGVAGHSFIGQIADGGGYMNRLRLVQNYSAVTAACLVVRREVFFQVGGLNEQDLTVAFNDIDLCLRLAEAGYRNVWTPFARLYHHESASRGREDTPAKNLRAKAEIAYMHRRWGGLLAHDPAYNPNLSLCSADFCPANPPRRPHGARVVSYNVADYVPPACPPMSTPRACT
ncbi:MAG TPA: glycosyltransferase family 2 protein [Rariglobus sp.]|nr:glycosyltransferase family 2 protein [Rariglobus sp.]